MTSVASADSELAGSNKGTVARAAAVLRVIAHSTRPVSVTELAAELELAVSTTHRLLHLLCDEGMIQPHGSTRRYAPGPELLRMAVALQRHNRVTEFIRPILARITAACNETAQFALYLPVERRMAFTVKVECSHPLRFSIPLNEPQSLVFGSSGRVILAHLSPEPVSDILAHEPPSTLSGTQPPSQAELEPVLARIRRDGWDVTEDQKLANAVGVAGPVLSAGRVIGSISIPIPTVRFREQDREHFIQLILDACARASGIPLPVASL